MILKETLQDTFKILAMNGIDGALFESELLLRQALKLNRIQFYQNFEQPITVEQQDTLQGIIERRLKGEPIAYIKGYKEFFGLDFYVNRDVLIPRPETEHLVEKALGLAKNYQKPIIADIGTGCGIIAIIVALNLPLVKIFASDTSSRALKVAYTNCLKHKVSNCVELFSGDMLQPIPEPVNLIVANLPYVKRSEIDSENFEPVIALNGGIDGLEKIKKLCRQVKGKLLPEGYLLLEIGQGQRDIVITLVKNLFPNAYIEVTPDLSGIDRVVSIFIP
jgi:release factor glutamine methyltransferase